MLRPKHWTIRCPFAPQCPKMLGSKGHLGQHLRSSHPRHHYRNDGGRTA